MSSDVLKAAVQIALTNGDPALFRCADFDGVVDQIFQAVFCNSRSIAVGVSLIAGREVQVDPIGQIKVGDRNVIHHDQDTDSFAQIQWWFRRRFDGRWGGGNVK